MTVHGTLTDPRSGLQAYEDGGLHVVRGVDDKVTRFMVVMKRIVVH